MVYLGVVDDEGREIRLPRTPRRGTLGYVKLVTSVAREARTGFAFSGMLLRNTRPIRESELYPDGNRARTPVVLEYAGAERRQGPHLYILWAYDGGEWVEVARTWAESWEWSLELAPAARRILAQGTGPKRVATVEEVAGRIRQTLDAELARLEPGEQARLACVLHDELAVRWADERRAAA
jgi:hypothetical protein